MDERGENQGALNQWAPSAHEAQGAQAVDLSREDRLCVYCRMNPCPKGIINCVPCMQNRPWAPSDEPRAAPPESALSTPKEGEHER